MTRHAFAHHFNLRLKSLLLALISLCLFACGGGGGGSVAPMVGLFIDDPVSGLDFACAGAQGTQTMSGITDAHGQFTYLEGQSCTFKVGRVTLGAPLKVPSDGKVTPQDVAGVTRSATAAPSAVAIARLLLSLNDGNTPGQIVISSKTRETFSNSAVPEITLASSTGGASQADLQNLVNFSNKELVSAAAATDALDYQIALKNVDTSSSAISISSPAILNSILVASSSASTPSGLSVKMTAMGFFSNGMIEDISNAVTWVSSDVNILTINDSGLATGRKKGTVAVTANIKPAGSSVAVKGSVQLTTIDPVLSSIVISHSNSLPAGLTTQLNATGTYTDGSTADLTHLVTWTSSNTRILSIDPLGLANGRTQGTATITATYSSAEMSLPLSASFTETVLPPKVLNLVIAYVQSTLTAIHINATALLQAVAIFTDNTTQTVSSLVSWTLTTLSEIGNATVSAGISGSDNATLTATSPGMISIVASYLGLESNSLGLTITVLPPTVQNSVINLNVAGINESSANGSITATDPQGYPLSFSIQTNGAIGKATVNSSSGIYSYTVSGHTTANSDSFKVQVSNGKTSSIATVSVTLNFDPLLQNQWHIQNSGLTAFSSVLPATGYDMNVAGAWGLGYSGKGIKVAVVDTGLEIAHEDLAANVDTTNSRNFLTDTNDPSPTVTGFDHGTQVAGIIGSVAFNGKGGRGVAYGATLRGYNFLSSQSTVNLGNSLGLATYSSDNDIFNESFGSSATNLDSANTNTYQAINDNLLSMRGGKGAILIQSAGNEFLSLNDGTTACNTANKYGVSCGSPATDARRNDTLPIIVGALSADGIKSTYSSTGSAIWVVAPGGEYGYDSQYISVSTLNFYKPAIVTTALTGCRNAIKGTTKVNALDAQGQNTYAQKCQYTALMNGTSSAAPNLSGVVALMLEANPNLGYRDVKYILAKTAKKVDSSYTGITSTTVIDGSSVPIVLDQGWVKNAAGFWFSNSYGFGAVDASGAVSMAKNYANNLPAMKTVSLPMQYTTRVYVPNGNATGSTLAFNMASAFSVVEQVMVTVNMTNSPALTCNQIELSSPSGTKSILMHAGNGFSNNGVLQTSIPGTRFISNAFYGESSNGVWSLRFLDFCTSSVRTTIRTSDIQTLSITGH